SDVLLFWFICRVIACFVMGIVTLWLGERLGSVLPTLFISAAAWCLPALLSLSGMKNGIEWLGTYPLFHAAALLSVQGYGADGAPYSLAWVVFLLLALAAALIWALVQTLTARYEWAGRPEAE
ncbi:MAG: hypothetical protein ACI4KN_06385, partial [Gemmiger sp.]